MFDYVVLTPKQEGGRPRYLTAGVSFLAHVVIVGAAVALPILYASERLPEPPDMMAFVVDVPPPPPPPPPPAPAPAAAKPQPTQQPKQALRVIENPLPQVAAPVEAPSAIAPETSAAAPAAPGIQAGFEGGVPGGIPGGVVGGVAGGVDIGEPAPPPPPPPAPKPVPQGPVRVGGQIKAPSLVNRVNPTYPPTAQSAQVEGSVVLEAQVDKTGRVQSVRAVKSHPLLEAAAVNAVKQWRYEPLLLNGEPVAFILTVTVSFTMPRP